MSRQASRSLRWIVTVGVAMGIAGFVGVSSASGETADTFDSLPRAGTAVEENDSAEGLHFATPGPSEPSTVGGAEQAPEAVQPAGTELPSDPAEHMQISAPIEEEAPAR